MTRMADEFVGYAAGPCVWERQQDIMHTLLAFVQATPL